MRTTARLALAAVAVGAAVAVAHDGTAGWRLIRLAVVAGLAILAWRTLAPEHRGRAAVAFAIGVPAMAAGVGLALPHAAKAGLTLVTAAGTALLVGGVALAAIGSVGVVRAAPSWWRRVPLGAALLVVVYAVTWSFGQAVAATNVPRTDVGARTPGDHGLASTEVTFPAADGVPLSGWYVPGRNGAGVVLLHGAGSTRSSVLDHAVVLARHGFAVLLYDARGHGRSGGRAMDFGWYGDRDLAGAVSFLAAQPDVDPGRIAAVGLSMGGEQATGAAAADPRLRAVVAEGATNRVAADKDWLSDEYGWRGALQERLDALTFALADLLTSARPPIALADAVRAAAPRPMLLIAAGRIEAEQHAARVLQAASPASVEVWVASGAGHTDALAVRPDEWEARVIAFLEANLRGA